MTRRVGLLSDLMLGGMGGGDPSALCHQHLYIQILGRVYLLRAEYPVPLDRRNYLTHIICCDCAVIYRRPLTLTPSQIP